MRLAGYGAQYYLRYRMSRCETIGTFKYLAGSGRGVMSQQDLASDGAQTRDGERSTTARSEGDPMDRDWERLFPDRETAPGLSRAAEHARRDD